LITAVAVIDSLAARRYLLFATSSQVRWRNG